MRHNVLGNSHSLDNQRGMTGEGHWGGTSLTSMTQGLPSYWVRGFRVGRGVLYQVGGESGVSRL